MNRIKLLRSEKNMLQEELGKIIGVSKSSIGYYENEKRDIPTDIAKKLANYFEVSIDYLLGYSDERYNRNSVLMIPVLGKIRAGLPIFADENIEEYQPVFTSIYNISNMNNYFYLKVVGDSMNKVVQNGAYVLVERQDYAENGDIVVAIVNGDNEATLKEFKQVDNFVILNPQSTDDSYKPITIDLTRTNLKIIGKVIGDFKKW